MNLSKGIYKINGVNRLVMFNPEKDTLADVLRRIGLTSVKVGCGVGQCGVCTVLYDGKPVRACVRKMKNVPEFTEIETVENIGTSANLHPLQRAWIKYGGVQCGFCTPGFIMSSKALLEANPSPTRQDVRDWFTKNNNLCRCTGYKQLVDAVMAAAEVMRGDKPIESLDCDISVENGIYGSKYPRPNALGKVLGVTDFGDDVGIKMPEGTLELGIKFSDEQHARILDIDISEAEKMPNVVKVILAKDIKGTNTLGINLPLPRLTINGYPQPLLCDKEVSRLGDAIAIVAATNREDARAAAKAIKVTYEKLPINYTYLDSCKEDAVDTVEGIKSPFFYQPIFKGEDKRDLFAKGETEDVHIVEGSFYSSHQPHLALEPDSCQAYYDEDDMLTINCRSQGVHAHQGLVAATIGVTPDKLRIVQTATGGSFGSGMGCEALALTGAAAVVLGQPVNFTSTYDEKQAFTGKRSASFANQRLACDSNGKILAQEFDSAIDIGAYGLMDTFGVAVKYGRFAAGLYNVPNATGLIRVGSSNQCQVTPYRAYGSPQAYTSSEQMIDIMARKLGIDPFEMRYRNLPHPGDTTLNSGPFKLYPLEEMMDKIRPDYEEALEWKKAPARDGWKRGVGVSLGGYHVSSPVDNSEVALELCKGGIITHYNGWSDQGQGPDIGSLAHTVEALKPLHITPDQVRLIQNDTKICPATGVAAGSRSHFMAGNATKDAAKQLLDAMRKPDGTYRTYEEMVEEGIPTKYIGKFSTADWGMGNLSPDDGHADPMPDQNFIINIARIEVEEATGKVEVVAVHSIADVGVVGNALALEGQALGGLMHSIGFALREDYRDEYKNKTPLGCGFSKCNDIPDDIWYMQNETPRKVGPFGSGGASECFQSCCHVCILNAIDDAVGVRIYEIPALPEKVKAAMDAKAAGKDMQPEKYYLGRDFYEVVDEIKANPVQSTGGVAGVFGGH